jgi:RecA/RadA recombinase
VVNGIFTDSLAALSTELEMGDGDPFGSRRAKEFSEQLRVTCREIKAKNYLMVASNQVREVIGATQYQAKTKTTGGVAISFYSSVRLQFSNPRKITDEVKLAGKTIKRVVGIETTVDVFKNSVWSPYRSAPLTIDFTWNRQCEGKPSVY